MRILYQIPGDLSAGPLGAEEIERRQAIMNGWAGSDVRIIVRDAPGGPLSIESEVEEAICVPPMIAAARAAEPKPEAIIIGCFSDPGLGAMREIFECPVVGPLQASLHLGAQIGRRVGIITVLEALVPLLDRSVRCLGEEDNYAGSSAIEIPVLELGRDPEGLLERVIEAARPLVADGRADVLCLGCMSLSFLEVTEQMSAALGIPVVNPAQAAVMTARTLVDMGLSSSRKAYPHPRKEIAIALDAS